MSASDFGSPLYGLVQRMNSDVLIMSEQNPEARLGVSKAKRSVMLQLSDDSFVGRSVSLFLELACISTLRFPRTILVHAPTEILFKTSYLGISFSLAGRI